jgi:hypothetical protein
MGFFTKSPPKAELEAAARQLQDIEADMVARGWNDWERTTIVRMLDNINKQIFRDGRPASDLLCGSREETIRAQYRVAKEQQSRMRAFERGEIKDARLTREEIATLMHGEELQQA